MMELQSSFVLLAFIVPFVSSSYPHSYPRRPSVDIFKPYRYGRSAPQYPRPNRSVDSSGWVPLIKPAEYTTKYQTQYVLVYPSADYSPSYTVATPQGKQVAANYGYEYKYEPQVDTASKTYVSSNAVNPETSDSHAETADYKKLYPEVPKAYYYQTSVKEAYAAALKNSYKDLSYVQYAPTTEASKAAAQVEPVYYYSFKPSPQKSSTPIEEPAQEPVKLPLPVTHYKKAVVQHVPVISASTEEKKEEEAAHTDEKYEFGYRVHDSHTGSEFGQMEQRHGSNSRGHYHVMLPDGRLQVVRYYTDHTGFHADVSYEGKATHTG